MYRGETGLGRLELMKRNTELLNDIVVSKPEFLTRIEMVRNGIDPSSDQEVFYEA